MEEFIYSKIKDKERFLYYKDYALDEEVDIIKKGLIFSLTKSMNIAKKKNINTITLLLTLKQNSEPLDKLFGEKNRKLLLNKSTLTIENLKFNCFTDNTIRKNNNAVFPILLAIYPTKDMLNYIQNIGNIKHEIIVPWMDSDLDFYKEAFFNNSEDKLDEYIQKELLKLSTFLSHTLDYNRAIDILKKLKKDGYNLDRVLIKIFLMNNGWMETSAEKLAQMAEKIENGRIVRKK